MPEISMMMLFKCSSCHKIVFDHLRISFNAANTVLMCKIGIKYQDASRVVCTYAHVFGNGQEHLLEHVRLLE